MHSPALAVDPVQTEVETDAEVAQLSSPTAATSTSQKNTVTSAIPMSNETSITSQSEDTTTAPPTVSQMQPPPTSTVDVSDVTHEDAILFYMNGSSQHDNGLPSKKKNSELAGDDSEDDLNDEDKETKPSSGQRHSNSSLATVAESATEKQVGLSTIVPVALISDNHQEGMTNNGSQYDDKAEVYLDTVGHGTSNSTGSSSAPLGSESCLDSECSSTLSASRSVPPNNTEALDKPTNINNESIHSLPTTPTTPPASLSTLVHPTISTSAATSTSSTTDTPASKPCDIDASKDMLTEGQAFAYVGLCLVTANTLFQALEGKETAHAKESLESFVSKLINRLYKHLEIDANSKLSFIAHF
ncbi:hypothetical protein BGZ92_007378 [Podila epicladia]|nr:hypothetical protein BGZ92_007378 [Podila epicladia]